MTTDTQTAFLKKAYSAALSAGHIFPGAAAAEAALESAWGTSGLATRANNLFGLKKSIGWTGKTVSIPTREFINGAWTTQPATWPVFSTWTECMTARMNTLHRVSRYASSLSATSPEQFITLVSSQWATDPNRGTQVLAIYRAHRDILAPQQKAA